MNAMQAYDRAVEDLLSNPSVLATLPTHHQQMLGAMARKLDRTQESLLQASKDAEAHYAAFSAAIARNDVGFSSMPQCVRDLPELGATYRTLVDGFFVFAAAILSHPSHLARLKDAVHRRQQTNEV